MAVQPYLEEHCGAGVHSSKHKRLSRCDGDLYVGVAYICKCQSILYRVFVVITLRFRGSIARIKQPPIQHEEYAPKSIPPAPSLPERMCR